MKQQVNSPIARMDLYGTTFSITNKEETVALIEKYPFESPAYICFPSTNIVAKARKNRKFQAILNNAYLTIPDGQVTQMYARFKGIHKLQTTSGFWLLKKLLKTNRSHYFYGSDPDTLAKIKLNIEREFPDAKVLGFKSPPQLSLPEIENNNRIRNDIETIKQLNPDLIWVGLTNIKQDYLMHHYYSHLNKGLMLGVGAVFLYIAGDVKMGPPWIKKLGLRWLLRILQEPKRQIKNTLPSVLSFVGLFIRYDILYPIFKLRKPRSER